MGGGGRKIISRNEKCIVFISVLDAGGGGYEGWIFLASFNIESKSKIMIWVGG